MFLHVSSSRSIGFTGDYECQSIPILLVVPGNFECQLELFRASVGTNRRARGFRELEVDMTRRHSHALSAATAFGIIGSAVLAAASPALGTGDEQAHMLLVFHSMYGVDGPFVGNTSPLRGIPGDDLPWTVESANGWLDTDGHLTLQVKGIVFTDDDEVPPNLRGTNDE